MRFVVAAVGRLRTPHFAAACQDYLGRLGHPCPTTVVEVKDPPRTGGGSADRWKATEATGLLAATPAAPDWNWDGFDPMADDQRACVTSCCDR